MDAGAAYIVFGKRDGFAPNIDLSAIGGFDAVYWSKPSVEDIHLGYLLGRRGHRIHMVKDLQVSMQRPDEVMKVFRNAIKRYPRGAR